MKRSLETHQRLPPQAAVDSWNSKYRIGQPVTYRRDFGGPLETTTRTEASVLSGHSAVVWLDGMGGCVALTHVTPRQPEHWTTELQRATGND